MLGRLVVGVGLFALGYHLGREIGRADPIRDELKRARRQNQDVRVAERHATEPNRSGISAGRGSAEGVDGGLQRSRR